MDRSLFSKAQEGKSRVRLQGKITDTNCVLCVFEGKDGGVLANHYGTVHKIGFKDVHRLLHGCETGPVTLELQFGDDNTNF